MTRLNPRRKIPIWAWVVGGLLALGACNLIVGGDSEQQIAADPPAATQPVTPEPTAPPEVPETLEPPATPAAALYAPTQLAQIASEPDNFQPTTTYTDSSVNSGFPVYSWEWEKDGAVDLELKRSPDNLQAWEMVLGSDEYTVSTFAPTKSVGTVNDPITNEDLSVYRIESGALEGVYLLDKRYKDGSGGITLQTGAFAEAGGLGSELDKTGSNFLLSYPLYGLLYAQGAMCALPEVTCE